MPYADFALRQKTPKLYVQIQNYLLSVEEMRFIKSVKVIHELEKADTCEIVFFDPEYYFLNTGIIQPQFYFMLYGGWDDELSSKGPFRIKEMDPDFPESGEVTYKLTLTDASVAKMSIEEKSISHIGKTASQVVGDIAREYNLTTDIQILPNDEVVFTADDPLTQLETDAKLLQKLCMRMGYVWGVRGGVLYFQRPDQQMTNPYIFEYRIGKKTLKDFKPKIKLFQPGGPKKATKCTSFVDFLKTQLDTSTTVGDTGDRAIQQLDNAFTVAAVSAKARSAQDKPGASFNINNARGDLTGALRYEDKKGFKFTPVAEVDPHGAKVDGNDGGAEALYEEMRNGKVDDALLKSRLPRIKAHRFIEKELASEKISLNVEGMFNMDDPVKQLLTTTLRSVDGYSGGEQTIYKFTSAPEPTAYTKVQADAGGAVPQSEDKAKKHAAKKFTQVAKPVEATMKPTIPSWNWVGDETVWVVGVADICEGLYTITKATLTYDNQKGLDTVLEAKKGKLGRKKKCSPGIVCYEEPGANGSLYDPNNPRNPLNIARENAKSFTTGFTRGVNAFSGAESVAPNK